MVLTGYRPRACPTTARARSFFWAREIKGFLEDLGFHRLLAQHALEIAHTLLQLADLGSAHNILIGLNRRVAAFEHAALPGEELGRGNAGASCHIGHAHARLHGFLYQPHLLGD
jgi:hypothetical protein